MVGGRGLYAKPRERKERACLQREVKAHASFTARWLTLSGLFSPLLLPVQGN